MIFVKTELGQQVIKDRSVALSASQRALLIMCDGVKSLEQLIGTITISSAELEQLMTVGLIADINALNPTQASASARRNAAAPVLMSYEVLYKVATKLTSGLGLRGFRLNLALESASSASDIWAMRSKIYDGLVASVGVTQANQQIEEFDLAAKLIG
jgi:hypothetical protein